MMLPIRAAFSGSGFKAPAHVGALFAFRDAGFDPNHRGGQSIGTSGGSLVAGLYACGMSLDDMKSLCMTKDWSEMMAWSPLAIRNLGYSDGKKLLAWLDEVTSSKRFSEISADFSAVVSNLTTNQREIFDDENHGEMPISLAIRASTSIPFVYEPVVYRDQIYQDGGMCSNIAADSLKIDSTPRIGIQLVSQETPMKANGRIGPIRMAGRAIDLMLSACESAHVTAAQAAGAKMAFIETGYASGLDRNMPLEIRQRLFEDGYQATLKALR
jgi:NTE family protein